MSACHLAIVLTIGVASSALQPSLAGQGRETPPAPRAAARIDLTGYWVAVVTEDWRWRMQTPPKGDYAAVPLTPEGRRIADAWDPAADRAKGDPCKAYGAAAIMRVPGRLHITWQDDSRLRVETDAGTQTRVFIFGAPPATPPAPSWQGTSAALWEGPPPNQGTSRGGSLKVVTTNMRAGYLRRNGVPYSEKAVLTEYFDIGALPGGAQVLMVTSVVEDPKYLAVPFTVTSHFKKEADGSKWDPMPCSATW